MRQLKDGVVLLTGASRGLGVEMARAFARQGARLALAARSAGDLESTRTAVEAAGAAAFAFPADVRDLTSLEKLVAAVGEQLGPIDVLVNNAGIEAVCDFETMSPEEIAGIIETNVTGLGWLTRLVVPSMIERRSGHVCNIASVAGLTSVPHNTVYSASKHAVVGFSRSLRAELADHDVEVSVVCPGFVTAGMFARWGRKPPRMAGSVTPERVARAVVRAVRRNRGEVVVNPGLGRIADWFQAAMPETTSRIMRTTGVTRFLREQARLNAEGDRPPGE